MKKNKDITKIITTGLLLLILLSVASAGTVTRDFTTQNMGNYQQLNVTLTVDTGTEEYYAIDEFIPNGWTITNKGTGSDQHAGHLKWVDIQNQGDTQYFYTLTVPNNLIKQKMAGEYMFQGMENPAPIKGKTHINQVGITITETNWKIESRSYITKYIDFTFTKESEYTYQVDWKWNNLEMKTKLFECAELIGVAQNNCIDEIGDETLRAGATIKVDLMNLNNVPITALTPNTGFTKAKLDLTPNTGEFKIILTQAGKGKRVKIGFGTTFIELTDVNVNILIDPETEACQDGLCKHNIDIDNQTDSNFCFNSLDIYGHFEQEGVTNQRMYFYQSYSDENASWNAWDLLTTQVCINPSEVGQLKYYYEVQPFTTGKWDFHFWYLGIDNEIDPYYNNYNWTFTQPTKYNYNIETTTINGNAFLNGSYGSGGFNAQWSLNESSGDVAQDSIGNSDGNLINMEDADWVTGKLGNALQFDGIDEYVTFGDVGDFVWNEPHSVEMWFKSGGKYLISKINVDVEVTGYRGWGIQIISGMVFWSILNDNSPAYYIQAGTTTTNEVNDGQWHHLVVVYNGTGYADNGMEIYIDSVKKSLSYNGSGIVDKDISSSANLQICGMDGEVKLCNGSIDEVVIYDYNLTQADVDARYNGGTGTETPAGDILYPTTNPTITPKYALTDSNTITQLNNFTETANKPAGTEIKYQISDDNGTTFYYWNGASWATASDNYTQSNTASAIDSQITSFSVSSPEEIKFRVYLHSDDGSDTPELDDIDINYTATAPTIPILDNNTPTTPTLIPQPDDTNTTRSFDWLTSTDDEDDTIRYHINVGTTAGANNKLDTNTYNTDHNNLDLTTTGTYYWQVRACDNNDTAWGNCSNWATDNFQVESDGGCYSYDLNGGLIYITSCVSNAIPLVEDFEIDPEIWDGLTEINVSYYCYDPNGAEDYNRTEIILTGANTGTIIPSITPIGSKYYIEEDISSYITSNGITTITAKCYDDTNQMGEAGGSVSYSPDHKLDIDYGADVTYDLIVDLNFTVPLTTDYMSFSCDNNNWSIWEPYTDVKGDFGLSNQPEIGCVAHGEGIYYVYASFSDGMASYATFDHIEAVKTTGDVNRPVYLSPEETTPTALFALGTPPIEWGLIIIIALVAGIGIYFWRKENTYAGYQGGNWKWH